MCVSVVEAASIADLVLGLRTAVGTCDLGEKARHALIADAIEEGFCVVLLLEAAFALHADLENEFRQPPGVVLRHCLFRRLRGGHSSTIATAICRSQSPNHPMLCIPRARRDGPKGRQPAA